MKVLYELKFTIKLMKYSESDKFRRHRFKLFVWRKLVQKKRAKIIPSVWDEEEDQCRTIRNFLIRTMENCREIFVMGDSNVIVKGV